MILYGSPADVEVFSNLMDGETLLSTHQEDMPPLLGHPVNDLQEQLFEFRGKH